MHWFTRSVTITITSQIMDKIINKQIEVEVHRQKLKKD